MNQKLTYLIATIALLTVSAVAMAQDGVSPFVGSTHKYTVVAENASGNDLKWSVLEGENETEYTINSGADGETLSITWNIAGTYTLQFIEEGTCSSVRQKTITVGANTFDVSTTSPGATCNSADGQVNASGDVSTSITFTVDMTTAVSTFSPNWEFTFTLTPGSGASIDNVAGSTGTLNGSGPYTLTGLASASGNGTVDITMDVTGDLNTALSVGLEITSAAELTYNSSDVDTDDWTATQTINALPATSDIQID